MTKPILYLLMVFAGSLPSARAAEPVDYLRDVKPVLQSRCYSCHGALRQRAGLRLDAGQLLLKGGDGGPVVVPGKVAESVLIDAVLGKDRPRMPPEKEGPPLTEKQIALLKAWIEQGAKAATEPVPEDPRKHWAFRRPVRPALPKTSDWAWRRNPIDTFVAARREKAGLSPVPEAPKAVLLRRVYLDLIGLPPTREELHTFLNDTSPDAYERVVDRLLNDPRHGERWARHWMDVWRYSDWYGRRGVPDVWNSAPQVWRWRDWIIESLNEDKGYDRMVVEMLAADEVAPEDDRANRATGYIVRNWYALNPNQWMRDLVEHTGKAFLGLTFNCAHCHDHKYDPISQEDYFRFRAFFEPLQVRQDRVPGEADPGPFQKYSYSVLRKVVTTGMVRVFDEKLDARTLMYAGGDERNVMKDRPPVAPGVPAFLGGRLNVERVNLPARAWYPGLKAFIRAEELAKREAAVKSARAAREQARQAAAEAQLAALRARIAADDARFLGAGGDAEELSRQASKAERLAALRVAEANLLQAGQALTKAKGNEAAAKKAAAGVAATEQAVTTARKALEGENTKYTPLSPVYPKVSTGRRRALATWIASEDNPLTARVAVNHIWGRHFNRPIVESVFDFGRNGKPPSHPELLDWLAVEFMESGWSMKRLHRLIVTSNTYRMASSAGSEDNPNLARDPDNRLLWRFNARRMEAEVVRDSVLYAAGELDGTTGGPPLDNKKDAASKRRGLYFSVYPEGGGHHPFLKTFDAPDPCDCYRRAESLVPQQALALTNSQLILDQSRLLARKLSAGLKEDTDAAFIRAAFEQVLTRPPSEQETALCKEFLRRQADLYRTSKMDEASAVMRARESLVRVLFNHDDFVTVR